MHAVCRVGPVHIQSGQDVRQGLALEVGGPTAQVLRQAGRHMAQLP